MATSRRPMPREEEQLEEVVAAACDVLGADVLGAYLFGSAVLGGLRPRSDLDVLVVSRRRTTHQEKRRLVDRLFTVSGTGELGRRPVELTLVVQSEIRPWRYPPRLDFQYGEWLRRELEGGNLAASPATNPDVAALITMVLLADRPLLGPPPAVVLDPVPAVDLNRAVVAGIEVLLQEVDSDTRNVVLTLARIWSTVATGVIRSKDAAASWALDRLPEEHRPVVARARAIYLGHEEEQWHDLEPQLRPHTRYVVAEIERLAYGGSSRGG